VTKLHEEFRRGKLSELSGFLEEPPRAGEITLLIGPEAPADARTHGQFHAKPRRPRRRTHRQATCSTAKEALKLAAKERRPDSAPRPIDEIVSQKEYFGIVQP